MIDFDYDMDSDSLYLYKKGEKAKHSVEVLKNFVIDLGFENDVASLEILNASKMLGVDKKELGRIKEAKISMIKAKGGIAYIAYSIRMDKIQLESQIQLPVAAA